MAMGYDAVVLHKANDNTHCVNTQELADRDYTLRGEEHPMDVEDIIRRMRQVYAVRYDTDLSAELGLSRAAPSNWRHRNSPPVDICAEIAAKKGVSLDWLIFGIGDMRLGARAGMRLDSDHQGTTSEPSPAADRISQFVYWWYVNRSQDEVVWLEQQFKRAVPEYGEWLAALARPTT